MSCGEEFSALAAALRRIEQRIEVLACRLATIDDRVAIIDLKLEGLDSIFSLTREIAAALGVGNGTRSHLGGH
jgi:hypothetical protein